MGFVTFLPIGIISSVIASSSGDFSLILVTLFLGFLLGFVFGFLVGFLLGSLFGDFVAIPTSLVRSYSSLDCQTSCP